MAICHKRRYSRQGAQMALLETKIRGSLHNNKKRREQRTYYHKPCKAWHITSMPIIEREDNGKSAVQEKSRGEIPPVR